MDNLHAYVPPQYNEELYDMALLREKEGAGDQLLDAPTLLDAGLLNMSVPSTVGDQLTSFPITEKVTSFVTPIPTVDKQVHYFGSTGNPSIKSNLSAPLCTHHSHVSSSRIVMSFRSNDCFALKNQPTNISCSLSIPTNCLSRNQSSHVGSSTNPSSFRSIGNPTHVHSSVISSRLQPNIYVPKKSQQTQNLTPATASQFCDVMGKHAYETGYGCISFISSSGSSYVRYRQINQSSFVNSSFPNGSFSMRNQQINSLSFANSPFPSGPSSVRNQQINGSSLANSPFPSGSSYVRNQQIDSSGFTNSQFPISNGCLALTNQLNLNPTLTNIHGTTANYSVIQNRTNFLQNRDHATIIKSNQSNPMRNHVGITIPSPRPNHSGSQWNQKPFAPGSLVVRQISSSIVHINRDAYKTCSECGKQFPTFHALGGHISSHAKAKKRLAEITRQLYASDSDSRTILKFPNGSTSISVDTSMKGKGFNSSVKAKQSSSSFPVEESAMEKFYSSEEIVNSSKRSRNK